MNPIPTCPKCASPLPADASHGHCSRCLVSGTTFGHGRYTLFQLMGLSRTCLMWKALDERMDGFVTLKFLADDLRSDRAVMEGLRLEVERARRLVHPNIARIHELHEAADEPAFVVTEWVKGDSLTDRLQRQPQQCFTWLEVEPMMLQLGQALDYAHREGVLHGNLTVADVWFDHEGRIKITGFGFACLSGVLTPNSEPAADVPAQTGWSPQQHAGQFAEITDDLYALGALGYELLSGRPPFYLGDVAAQARYVQPKPLEERIADFALDHPVPSHVAAALQMCLAKERADRPESVTDFVLALAFETEDESPTPVLQPEPAAEAASIPRPEPPAARAPLPPVRWPRVAVGAGLAAVILLVGLGVVWFLGFRSNTQALVAAAQLAAGEVKTTNTQAHAQSQPAASPAPGPVGRDVAFTNSLGMPFVPVANTQSTPAGRPVRFCCWLTRVQDFEAFVRATGHNATDDVWSFGAEGWKSRGHNWRTPGFEQTGMHPVSGVSWEDAQAFAKWLTDKEQAEGRLAPGERYRLPYDWEWSVAVGLAETRDGLPKDRNMRIKDVFPWGTQWPPPAGAGNYGNFIPGFRDGFERSSPVGIFPTNRFGLHDMGGNLWQWCEDWFDAERVNRPLRGGSWSNDPADTLWSSYRHHIPPHRRVTSNGFRVVLAHEPPSRTYAALLPADTRAPGNNLPAAKNETLWNEKSDFAHWRGEAQFWSIENGILTGRMTGPGHKFLTWTGSPVDDFELVLVFRTKGDGQAELRYRTGDVPSKNTGELMCYSVMLNERTTRGYPGTERAPMMTQHVGKLHSSIVEPDGKSSLRTYWPYTTIGHANASLKLLGDTLRLNGRSELIPMEILNPGTPAPAGGAEWSELIINAQARRLAHWRNGRLVTAVLDSDFPTARGRPTIPDAPGGIQLELSNYLPGQSVPPGMTIEVQFKEIRLTRLPKVPPIRITNAPPAMFAPSILPRPAVPLPRPVRLEAEQWPILEQQDCKASPQTMTAFGAQLWSGGKQLFCGSGARGLIAFNLPVERAGRYRLELLTTVAPDFGTYQVSINGQKVGSVVDGFGRTVRPANRISLGPVQLAAGNNRLQFQITGKNPLSTGHYMGLDCLDLIPVAP